MRLISMEQVTYAYLYGLPKNRIQALTIIHTSANRTHTELVFMRMGAIGIRANLCLLSCTQIPGHIPMSM